ncbi:hypothetical protein Hypma_011343 [Hypsizygus marmoreus]|uniref:Uncharacterized protein n=1 Tax=Hypsizygus marmoreus TaxID=39966 RepID=A0A369JKW2_HYPMA|nr:hypothetical protein Hypma_011343 [Hypsizygus marmoreus]
MASTSTPNTLGLDFEQLKIKDQLQPTQTAGNSTAPVDATSLNDPDSPHGGQAPLTAQGEAREKKKPYINTERVKTGGNQRDKLSEEALTERMARMREQNEKIKQRRLDVQADEDAFRKTQESERAKLAQIRKVQENVDRTREQNAKRKMDKIQSREWDTGKPTGDWKHQAKINSNPAPATDIAKEPEASAAAESTSLPEESSGWTRGGPRGGGSQRSRGRGRGRGGSASAIAPTPQRDTKSPTPATEPSPSTNSATTETSNDAIATS